MRWQFVALAVAVLGFLGLQHWRQRAATRASRRSVYDDCQALFEAPQIDEHGAQFPSLTGQYQGKRIRLDALIDSASVRKVPSVWLQLNVVEALPIGATLDLLVRPLNTEFFSPSAELPLRLDVPSGWPEHAIIKADREDAVRLLPQLDTRVRELFADVKCKELLITPKGVRLVYQLAQAERADYLVLRAMVFDNLRVASTLCADLLDKLMAIHADLQRPQPGNAQ
jgi:hypothetical protein